MKLFYSRSNRIVNRLEVLPGPKEEEGKGASMADLWDNPMGTDGFEFIEWAAPEPDPLGVMFERVGFQRVACHRSKDVRLYRQGDVNFVVNAEPGSFGQAFAQVHGASVCAIGLRVKDAARAHERALELGAWGVEAKIGPMELRIPAIKGIGDSLIYLVDRYGERGTIYDVDFEPIDPDERPVGSRLRAGSGIVYVDHLTNNTHRGRMVEWAGFYERLFNFREMRYFDIEGHSTGLKSKAMWSPCGKIKIPVNESSDDRSQVEEYLDAYRGEGVQHIALGSDDIFATVDDLAGRGVTFLDTPDTYYEQLEERIPGHGEDIDRLRQRGILVDGDPNSGKGLLLQIFTDTMAGPIFFEIIQRKGNEGFGEGNFQALFEAIERDQLERGAVER